MAAQVETRARTNGGCRMDQERLGAALLAALELALVAAHRLLAELDSAAGRPTDAAAHLARALTGTGATPHGRALALLALVEPCATTDRPAVPVPPCEGRAGPGAHSAVPAPACRAGLTRRELEVLRLIAQGRSNREIAAALYLSPRTAERHVANIYLKLGAHSKAEAAAYALRHGLA